MFYIPGLHDRGFTRRLGNGSDAGISGLLQQQSMSRTDRNLPQLVVSGNSSSLEDGRIRGIESLPSLSISRVVMLDRVFHKPRAVRDKVSGEPEDGVVSPCDVRKPRSVARQDRSR